MKNPVIVWFRNDMRLDDHPAFVAAHETGRPLICLFIDDTQTGCKDYYKGGAVRWWMHYALTSLAQSLADKGGQLLIRSGDPLTILKSLIAETGAEAVYWNRLYMPQEISRDTEIKSFLKSENIDVKSFKAALLKEPHEVKTMDGDSYKVYSPFRRAAEKQGLDDNPLDCPENMSFYATDHIRTEEISALFPLPQNPDWAVDMRREWDISEHAAHERLREFADFALGDYKTGRDFPAKNYVSRMSPYLARGMITPRRILYMIRDFPDSKGKAHYISELLWREFSYYLLFHYPHMETRNFRSEWDRFPWENNDEWFKAWKQGKTGVPIVDAGMRELRSTGYMHNRTRMLVGSFLVKHLLIDWRHGEAWFRDNLVDFDVASNVASWQWVAGSGADAAPYFRIFNPALQSKKFDPEGEYIKRHVSELMHIKYVHIHDPWEEGIKFNGHYPDKPLVDLKAGRDKALEIYHSLKNTA
ncbi:MAG: deoxyribodipyrimidine photo-lyase [Pseudomonadota bacterium]